MTKPIRVHATTIAIDGEGFLLRGSPGAGKSDLALRLIDDGAGLVADDQTMLRRDGERVVASAPPAIRGLFEVRGMGIMRIEALLEVPLLLIVDLVAREAVERMPEKRTEDLLGVALPLIALSPFDASAAAKLRLARRALAAGPAARILGPL